MVLPHCSAVVRGTFAKVGGRKIESKKLFESREELVGDHTTGNPGGEEEDIITVRADTANLEHFNDTFKTPTAILIYSDIPPRPP